MTRAGLVLLSTLAFLAAISCDSAPDSSEAATTPAPVSPVPTSSTPTPPDPSEPITFDADLDQADRMTMYLMTLDGEPEALSTGLEAQAQPAWSPDYSKIAFSGVLRDRDEADIFVMDADGGNLRRVTKGAGNDIGPDWSPDGTQIVFSRGRFRLHGKPRSQLMEIYVVDIDSGSEAQLTQNRVIDASPDWSPDGAQITFGSDRTGTFDIWTMTPEGKELQQITDNELSDDLSPRWSPDGKQVLFSRSSTAGSWIGTVAGDGSSLHRLTYDGARDFLPVWSPDGSFIAFVRGGADADIYVMTSDGGELIQLTSGKGLETNPAWAS